MVLRDANGSGIYRVLYIDEEQDCIALIRLDSVSGMPYWVDRESFCEEFENGGYFQDPNLAQEYSPHSSDNISSAQREHMERLWPMIEDFVTDRPACYDFMNRKEFVNSLKAKDHWSDSTIRRVLHRYWALGESKYALVPRFDRRGRRSSAVSNRPGVQKK